MPPILAARTDASLYLGRIKPQRQQTKKKRRESERLNTRHAWHNRIQLHLREVSVGHTQSDRIQANPFRGDGRAERMDRRSRMMPEPAGKENASRPLAASATKRVMAPPQRQQHTPAVVPNTPKARVEAAAASGTGRGGRGSGLSLRSDGNGGAPPSALRASTAAATAFCSSKRQGGELVDTSNSSSDFSGPQRVRVSNSIIPPDLSLSFWPPATPDSKTSRLKSKTVSRAARTTTATAAVTPLHHHSQAEAAPREPSTVARDTIASSSRKNAAQSQSAVTTRKRARPAAVPAAAQATAATAAEAQQQVGKGISHGGGKIPSTGVGASDSGDAKESCTAAHSSLSSRTDYSHILSWEPAPRRKATAASASSTASNTKTATTPACVSVDRLSAQEEGGGGPAPAGHQQRRPLIEQPATTSAAARAKEGPTPATATSARPTSASSAGASGGPSLGARAGVAGEGTQAGAGAGPRTRATPTPSVSGVRCSTYLHM